MITVIAGITLIISRLTCVIIVFLHFACFHNVLLNLITFYRMTNNVIASLFTICVYNFEIADLINSKPTLVRLQ